MLNHQGAAVLTLLCLPGWLCTRVCMHEPMPALQIFEPTREGDQNEEEDHL